MTSNSSEAKPSTISNDEELVMKSIRDLLETTNLQIVDYERRVTVQESENILINGYEISPTDETEHLKRTRISGQIPCEQLLKKILHPKCDSYQINTNLIINHHDKNIQKITINSFDATEFEANKHKKIVINQVSQNEWSSDCDNFSIGCDHSDDCCVIKSDETNELLRVNRQMLNECLTASSTAIVEKTLKHNDLTTLVEDAKSIKKNYEGLNV